MLSRLSLLVDVDCEDGVTGSFTIRGEGRGGDVTGLVVGICVASVLILRAVGAIVTSGGRPTAGR